MVAAVATDRGTPWSEMQENRKSGTTVKRAPQSMPFPIWNLPAELQAEIFIWVSYGGGFDLNGDERELPTTSPTVPFLLLRVCCH